MNIVSILLKKIILDSDSETWSKIRKNYLPAEYHSVYNSINKYFEEFSHIPSFDALQLSVRSNAILEKIYAIQAVETVDVDNTQLLEFLKNEYTQEEILRQLEKYLNSSIMIDNAKDNVEHLQEIIFHIEEVVDLKDPNENLQKMPLFPAEEELEAHLGLGLNSEYDSQMKFAPGDYILIGGRRGSGKSLACANIAANAYLMNRSSIYFTIEMTSRAILQRETSIITGIPARFLRMRNLSQGQWAEVAKFWSGRYEGGEEVYQKYLKHFDFDKLHESLSKLPLKPVQLDIIYDPNLTLATIRSVLDKQVPKLKPSVILVDYVNQIKRNSAGRGSQYDWVEQIDVSTTLKTLAQEYGLPLVSPYQIDASGEARFSKGLLDSCDAAFTIDPHNKEDGCITFKNVKMRDYEEVSFTSKINWETLKIGPESMTTPSDKKKKKADEDADDL